MSLRHCLSSSGSDVLNRLFVGGGFGWRVLVLVLLLLGHVLFWLRLVPFLVWRLLSWAVFIFLLISLTIFVWRTGLRILWLAAWRRIGVSRGLVSEWHRLAVSEWLLVHLHLHLLLVHHVWWHVTKSVHVVLVVETNWHRRHVLVWVESSEITRKSSQISDGGDLDHLVLVLVVVWVELGRRNIIVLVIAIVVSLLAVVALHLLRHWRKSDTFWKIWKWVDQLSSLSVVVIEWAAVTEFAFASVLARLSFVVGVNSTESGLTKVLWERLL